SLTAPGGGEGVLRGAPTDFHDGRLLLRLLGVGAALHFADLVGVAAVAVPAAFPLLALVVVLIPRGALPQVLFWPSGAGPRPARRGKACFPDPPPWRCLRMPGPRSPERAHARVLSSRPPNVLRISEGGMRRQRLIGAGQRRAPSLVPAALAEPVEIGRQDRLDRGRRNAQRRQG